MNKNKAKLLPDQEYLLECFNYNPETGELIWKHRPQSHFTTTNQFKNINGRYPVKEAGSIFKSRDKRIMIWVGGERFYKQRIIWKIMTGNDPKFEIDHEDNNTLNNKWSNLRECNDSENSCNRRKRKDNTSGFKGVYLRKESGRYRAKITKNKKTINLGNFDTSIEAHEAYCLASQEYHKEFKRYG